MEPGKKKDPLTRAIEAKKRNIEKSRELIADIRSCAEERVTKIQKNIARQQILLTALQLGTLKP